ncbi:Uncharacterised protein [Mycobacteroides abscessus subsp. massiliense]|nr:Uncharacterised protein [Mycobacteroides abscessus subsp. massiliense]
MLRLLQERRGDADKLGEGNPVRDAACELLDELLRRTQTLSVNDADKIAGAIEAKARK